MDRADVPPGCLAIRCDRCGDHLAIPKEPANEQQARANEAMADHELLCPGPPPSEPVPVDEHHHGTLRQQFADLVMDSTWCPGQAGGHHCGHWKRGGHCCACHEDRPEGLA